MRKGTVLTGKEILILIATGDAKLIENIFRICHLGTWEMRRIQDLPLQVVLESCHNDDMIFIKITKGEQE